MAFSKKDKKRKGANQNWLDEQAYKSIINRSKEVMDVYLKVGGVKPDRPEIMKFQAIALEAIGQVVVIFSDQEAHLKKYGHMSLSPDIQIRMNEAAKSIHANDHAVFVAALNKGIEEARKLLLETRKSET
jgi:hypothetical protein